MEVRWHRVLAFVWGQVLGLSRAARGLFSVSLWGIALIVLVVLGIPNWAAGADAREDSMPDGIVGAVEESPESSDYVVIGWNDLGMHCINPSYKLLAILPPFNNLWAQVIKRGEPPQIVTSGISLEYTILDNTSVLGKTDFWKYAPEIFGLNLPIGVGLTGNGLSGDMTLVGDHFEATGIPVLPRDDQMHWNPYQIAKIRLKLNSGEVVRGNKVIQVVLPVSDELNCAKCHGRGGDALMHIRETGSVEGNILAAHDYYYGKKGIIRTGPSLLEGTPVLCASCHSDNALGMPGNPRFKSLSEAMHGWHAQFPDAGCYDCHPGAKTQCLRTAIGNMGYSGTEPSCVACHGGMRHVASSISEGRKPWLKEPSCKQCHGKNYSTGKDLYRHAKGHGGVYCVACHNSPHAWWPSKLRSDNWQPHNLQNVPISIGECKVCHLRKTQAGNNPHVTYLPKYPKH
jgi:hypothetical protein